eukprot:645633-Heterocapsa_arctica.AAC.1
MAAQSHLTLRDPSTAHFLPGDSDSASTADLNERATGPAEARKGSTRRSPTPPPSTSNEPTSATDITSTPLLRATPRSPIRQNSTPALTTST